MTPESIPLRPVPTLECRSCGAGAPVDEHFCPNCSRILAIGRHGDYFAFLGLPRALTIDVQDLERRFRELSRKLHPDFYYNASPSERLASLERSSYLNDAVRTLRNPVARIEHLLAIEGLPPARMEEGTAAAPPALLEEVFALNEELDGIRELREAGAPPAQVREHLDRARVPIDRRRAAHDAQLSDLMARWDAQQAAGGADRRAILVSLRERLLERNYINNLLATIEREASGASAPGSPIGGASGTTP
jgi:Fe-S protein assembly co-chaperone HscB